MNIPKQLLYSEEHMWVQVDGDVARIGMTEFAQNELGEIVFAELPKVGDEIQADEPFGSVESVKTVSELYAPLSGKVTQINEQLAGAPELVNNSPYEQGWMIAIALSDKAQLDKLWSSDQYIDTYSEV